VDQQIIITDWALRGGKEKLWNLRRNIKKAFTIIMVAASTTIAAMLSLAYPAFSGLYALRGFAIVTILGVLVGILIARPAYARIIEIILE
nr:preprotein translocase subunit SecD [Candidatus Undinarchaeales archaeon ERR594346 U_76725]